MAEIEVFRITPEVGEKCYEYAESTRSQGSRPNEKRFTNVQPRYVGRLIRFETGGWGDGGWRKDYFEDNNGIEQVVNYSYEGNTCFREVPCRSSLPEEDDHQGMIIKRASGGKGRRHKRSKKTKRSKRKSRSRSKGRSKGRSKSKGRSRR